MTGAAGRHQHGFNATGVAVTRARVAAKHRGDGRIVAADRQLAMSARSGQSAPTKWQVSVPERKRQEENALGGQR
jgi:hypothetical protein